MDHVDGQMDVFEVLDLIAQEGISPLGKVHAGNLADFAEISARPLWNRLSSPAPSVPIPPLHSRTYTGGHRANHSNDHGDGGTAGSTSDG